MTNNTKQINSQTKPNTLDVSFFGAARTVTGSLYFLEYTDSNLKPFSFTIDAGMFQVGSRVNLYRINSFLGFNPKELDAIVLTHAHLDHCGRIPYLVKMGFNGKIYSTPTTLEIASVVMLDSARMQDEQGNRDALPQEYKDIDSIQKEALEKKFIKPNSKLQLEQAQGLGKEGGLELNSEKDIVDIVNLNKTTSGEINQIEAIQAKLTEGEGFLKLYSTADVTKAISLFQTHDYHEKFKIHPELEIEYFDAGHILGSAFVIITNLVTGQQVAFSGDLGNVDKPIIIDPERPPKLKNLTNVFTETTYGDKQHGKKLPKLKLQEACLKTLQMGNKVFIPAFSVERAQEIVYFLNELMDENSLPYVPVYLDSPMATAVVDICIEHEELYDEQMKSKVKNHKNPFKWNNLKILETRDDSKAINYVDHPCIIIAGSGMLTGGRILKHLERNISNPDHMLVFCGYQAEGTLGRKILDGEKIVEINDRKLDVKIQTSIIREFSAHADQLTLLSWLDALVDLNSPTNPTLYLMHGEKSAIEGYQKLVNESIPKVKTYWPKFAEKVNLY
jgi:metallo-beta-lactamase family protein